MRRQGRASTLNQPRRVADGERRLACKQGVTFWCAGSTEERQKAVTQSPNDGALEARNGKAEKPNSVNTEIPPAKTPVKKPRASVALILPLSLAIRCEGLHIWRVF
jgi:hypothetical protein